METTKLLPRLMSGVTFSFFGGSFQQFFFYFSSIDCNRTIRVQRPNVAGLSSKLARILAVQIVSSFWKKWKRSRPVTRMRTKTLPPWTHLEARRRNTTRLILEMKSGNCWFWKWNQVIVDSMKSGKCWFSDSARFGVLSFCRADSMRYNKDLNNGHLNN